MVTSTDNNSENFDVNGNLTPGRPLANIGKVTAAFGNRYTPTSANLVQILAPEPKGGRVTAAGAYALDTCTDTEVALFVGTSAATAKYRASAKITGGTISNTVKNPYSCDFNLSEGGPVITLGPNQGLWAGLAVAQTNGVNVFAEGGAYTGT